MSIKTTPASFDLSVLPEALRQNWNIYIALRSDAQVAYAKAQADAAVGNMMNSGWCAAFDQAAVQWVEANPTDPIWDAKWPDGADTYLGNAALEEARSLLATDK